MGTGIGTFIGKYRILSVVSSPDSHKIKWHHISVPKHILVIVREWKSWRFSMPDMNAALQVYSLRNKYDELKNFEI